MRPHNSVDLVIIGSGTAGISAYKEASKITDNIILIDHGPIGTTCARIGCMPSKSLIQAANLFHDRMHYHKYGIRGGDQLAIDIPAVMQHIRKLRDYFTSGTINFIENLGDRFIKGNAEFLEPTVIRVGQKIFNTKNSIIATGASSVVPEEWQSFSDRILTAESFFEQTDYQSKIAVIGGGPIGLELGQALSRLGIEIEMFHSHSFIGKLSDPVVNEYAINYFKNEFKIHLEHKAVIESDHDASLKVKSDNHVFSAQQIVAALGVEPNLSALNLAKSGIKLDKSGFPLYDRTTMQIQGCPIYIAGDVTKFRPLLHEAADEGRIAGYNAVREKQHCFIRRTPLMIIFTQPNIAIIGHSYEDLKNTDFVVGEVKFDDQGRARIMSENHGILRIYAQRENGKLLGAEMIAPAGEHLAHLLSHAIQQNLTAFDVLQMPFYHPVIEEGMRTALRDLIKKISTKDHQDFDLLMCDSEAAAPLS